MNVTQAKVKAEQYITENFEPPENDAYAIVDAAIIEVADGWYFPYQTVRFIETRNIDFSVLGNWPIFVSKQGECLGPRRPTVSK